MKCAYCKEQLATTSIELLSGEYRELCEDCKAIIDDIRKPLTLVKKPQQTLVKRSY